MNKKDYIANVFRKILKEDLEEKAESLMNKLNYDKTLKLNKSKEFDYVQEEKSMCNECGGSLYEGECSECGWKGTGEVMELGGMEDGHPKFGKMKFKSPMTDDEIEKLLRGDDEDEDDYEEFDFSEYDDDDDEYEDLDVETDWNELEEKFYGNQAKLDKNKNGRLDKEDFEMLRKQQDEEQLYEIEFEKEMEEGETEEGNAFTGALADAKKHHKDEFEVDGKKYNVKESTKEMSEKWKGEVDVKQTGEYSDMSIEQLNAAIKKQKAKNDKTKEDGKKVSHADKTKMSQLYFAKRAKQGWKGKGKAKVTESILFTETDLIDLIEKIVIEEKNNIKFSEPKGYSEYEKAHKADKKENEDYLKSVAKKMTDYLKNSSDKFSKYEMKETSKFPTENGGMKAKRKKYTPSDAVDEYIEAFSYPGQTNLVYDEIKPNDKSIEGQLKGSSTNGNAQVDKDGKALGNVVPSEVGERFYKNFKENLYGQEQQNASYKRQPQPVDQAGENTERGSLKSKRGKKTSQSVLNKLEESKNIKKENHLNEEFDRIQQLMGYNRKTQ